MEASKAPAAPRKFTAEDAAKERSDYDKAISRATAKNRHVTRSRRHYSREA